MASGKQQKRRRKAARAERGERAPAQQPDPAQRLESQISVRGRCFLVAGLLAAIALLRVLYLVEFGDFVF